MQEAAEQQEASPGEGTCETLAQLKLEERRLKKVKENQQRNKEHVRYGRIPSPCAGLGVAGRGECFNPWQVRRSSASPDEGGGQTA